MALKHGREFGFSTEYNRKLLVDAEQVKCHDLIYVVKKITSAAMG